MKRTDTLTRQQAAFCKAFVETEGNVSQSARDAEVSRSTAHRWLEREEIQGTIERLRAENAAKDAPLHALSPDDQLIEECRRFALDHTLKPADRLKALQTYERLSERSDARRGNDDRDAVNELRAFIDFAIHGKKEAGPFASIEM